jgi:hypothetical protein
MAEQPTPVPMGMLQRRRIEAEIIKPIYEAMKREIGAERAQAILTKAIREAAIEAARGFAATVPGGPSLESLHDLLPLWTKDDAQEIEMLSASPTQLDFNVRRCRYAEMYRAMGMGDIGHILSCNRDGAFCEGFDPKIRMQRTQTIMGGADHCDFRYQRPADGDAPAGPQSNT